MVDTRTAKRGTAHMAGRSSDRLVGVRQPLRVEQRVRAPWVTSGETMPRAFLRSVVAFGVLLGMERSLNEA